MTKKDAPAPEPMDVEADVPIRIGSKSRPRAPVKPLMARRGQIMDFAPNRRGASLVSREAVSDTSAGDINRVSIMEDAAPESNTFSEMPTNATPRKRLFIGDIKPIRKARRPQMKTSQEDTTEALAEPNVSEYDIVEKPVENFAEELPDELAEIPTPPLGTPVEKPRRRGLRMDFIKRVSAVIKPTHDEEDIPEEPAHAEEQEASELEELEEDLSPQATPRRPVVMDVSSVSKVDIRREPSVEETGDASDDDLPPQNEDELSAILAGFADNDAPDMTDNLSKEVADFEEELDALEDLEEAAAEFVSEPKPLFMASGADPLVEQSVNRKKPEIKEPTTYIDGSIVREDDDSELNNVGKTFDDFVETPKPPVEPYRQILGGKSPFLNSVNVEKRPLSGYAPEQITSDEQSEPERLSEKRTLSRFMRSKASKNEETSRKSEDKSKDDKVHDNRHSSSHYDNDHGYGRNDAAKHEDIHPSHFSNRFNEPSISIPSNKPKGLSLPLVLAIILTLILGAGAGAFIYLVFLQ